MDSISQFVLGASVGLAISPQKSVRIALIGGLVATLPDLDVFIDYGDAVSNIVNHRSFTHSALILSLFSLPLAFILQKIWQQIMSYWRWVFFAFSILLTHVALDSLTIYGTQVLWPFDVPSVMVGSIFIIDINYTLPLLISFIWLLRKKYLPIIFGLSINTWVLLLSTLYLALSMVLQNYVNNIVPKPISHNSINRSLVTPTPSNLVIWRVVLMDDKYVYENFYNLFTGAGKWNKIAHQQQNFQLGANLALKKYKKFSHGFYRLLQKNDKLIISDLRMGTTNMPVFNLAIAEKKNSIWQPIKAKKQKSRFGFKKMFGY